MLDYINNNVLKAAHAELPHLTVVHHMVSNTNMESSEEGWAYIDKLGDMVCTMHKITNIYDINKINLINF
jgi:hypothetical protein